MPGTLRRTGVFVNAIDRRIPASSAWKRGRSTGWQRGRQVRRVGRAGPGKGRAPWRDTEGWRGPAGTEGCRPAGTPSRPARSSRRPGSCKAHWRWRGADWGRIGVSGGGRIVHLSMTNASTQGGVPCRFTYAVPPAAGGYPFPAPINGGSATPPGRRSRSTPLPAR